MTDKEKLDAIRAEIHRLVDVRGYDREMANDLFTFMDSLPNEPVSEELEEAADEYAPDFSDSIASKAAVNAVRDAFKAGAQWYKEQMMAKAVETTFNVSLPSSLYDKFWIKGCKEGNKLLVIKKDEL